MNSTDAATQLTDAFRPECALTIVEALSATDMAGRAPGRAGHTRAIDYLTAHLKTLGLLPRAETFPIREVLALAHQPTAHLKAPTGAQTLKHRVDFAEHPRSAPMPIPVSGTVSDHSAGPGQWAALLKVPQGQAFDTLAAELHQRGCTGILTAQDADGSGFLTKRVQTMTPAPLPVIAVRTDLLATAAGSELTAHVPLTREPTTGTNLHATVHGHTPGAREVLITAHFDGVGSDPERHFACAGDNASGTAVVCEAARVLVENAGVIGTVHIALLDAEELGTLGSACHAAQLREKDHRVTVLNVDMAGKYNGTIAIELGPATDLPHSLIAALDGAGRQLNLPLAPAPVASDNRRYAGAGLPAAGIGLGAAHYHSPLDDLDRIDPSALHKAGRLLLATVAHLQHS